MTSKSSKVSFYASAKIRSIPKNLSEEEIKSVWYSSAEMKAIRAERNQTSLLMSVGGRSLKHAACTLGVHTKLQKEEVISFRRMARRAVVEEHQKQARQGRLDEEALSDVYVSYTWESARDARIRAAKLRETILPTETPKKKGSGLPAAPTKLLSSRTYPPRPGASRIIRMF